MAKDDLDLGEEKKSSRVVIYIVAGLLVIVLVVIATLYFTGFFSSEDAADPGSGDADVAEASEAAAADENKLSVYHKMEPPFIVNFSGEGMKLLQVSISVLAGSEETVAALQQHNPMLRNNILMLLSTRKTSELQTAEGKLALQVAVLEEIRNVMDRQAGGSSDVEQVFFTGFVMQ